VPLPVNYGDIIYCNAYNPKGEGAIYRYDGNNTISYYPSRDIVASWDPNWESKIKNINCTGYTLNTVDIVLKPS